MQLRLRYNYRVYPALGQQEALARAFGCARVAFNDGLRARQEARKNGEPYLSDGELSKRVITEAKRTPERAWLGEVSAVVLQQAMADLNSAYRNFFNSVMGKRKGRKVAAPRFRSRKDNRQAIRFTRNARFAVLDNGRLRLPKIGDVPVRWSRNLPAEPSSVTVIRDAAGRYFASFVVQTAEDETLPSNEAEVGIDLGLTHFAVLSDGTKIAAPKFLRRAARKLRRLQQDLSRKQRGSNNRQKGCRQGGEGTCEGGRHPAGLAAQAVHGDHPRQPSGVRRGPVRGRSRPDPTRQVGTRCGLGPLHRHAGVQGHPVQAHLRPGGPVLPVPPACAPTAAGSPISWICRPGRGTARAERPTTETSTRP
ncbi:RNA-guided endonuclease InsQ/TnpB family protein [Micromonospora sp. WMMD558]|uniref:RNA-guided endonuclease InsQ/TnpB family protein n=1 Tax=Micromonospora sp. WMMD558 TaxID=3403462 RepID=UPI001E5A0C53|nr:transposase [Micromonospora sp. WMMC415]